MVLSIGHFNIAIGSMGALAGIFTGALLESYSVSVYVSIMLGIIVGSLLGAIQGLIIAKTGIEGKKSVCGKLR